MEHAVRRGRTTRRSDLAHLAVFKAVVDARGFRGASRELGLSVSAVSHAVSTLEASLGVRLLARTTRSIHPTAAGVRLLAGLEPALETIDAAVEAATEAGQHLTGRLRLTVPRTSAETVLVPLVSAFSRLHPGVIVEMLVEDRLSDIVAGGFDAGVRFGEQLEQDMVAVQLGPQMQAAIVASPSYLDGKRYPQEPEDLRDHRCIGRIFTTGADFRWEFERDGKAVELSINASIVFNDDALVVAAALQGAGVGYTYLTSVAAHLASGRLIRLLEEWTPPWPGFFLYYPDRKLMRPVFRAFIDFVQAARVSAIISQGNGQMRSSDTSYRAR